MGIGGFKLPGVSQFTQPGVQQANSLLESTKYTAKEVGWATGGPRTVGTNGGTTIAPKGVTTGGGSPADIARAFASPTELLGGKLGSAMEAAEDGVQEWANPYAKPAELGPPTPPPLVQATPVGDPSEWALPSFPQPQQPIAARPPSKLKEGDGDVKPVAPKQSDTDPLFVVAALALGAVLLFL